MNRNVAAKYRIVLHGKTSSRVHRGLRHARRRGRGCDGKVRIHRTITEEELALDLHITAKDGALADGLASIDHECGGSNGSGICFVFEVDLPINDCAIADVNTVEDGQRSPNVGIATHSSGPPHDDVFDHNHATVRDDGG